MKILLLVPDGVAVRNYIYSSFISELEKSGIEVMLYHQISESAINEIKTVQGNLNTIQRIPSFVESSRARLLRESLAYARLLRNKKALQNRTIMSFWGKKGKGLKQKILYKTSEILGFIFSKSYSSILKFEAIYDTEIAKSNASKLIKEDLKLLNPDFILNLHQRAPITAPIINEANKLNIKTATVIFSWDNVPKARLISRYDNYFTWSDLMKKELNFLYPEIDLNQIKVVGTPQFEFYFHEKYGIDKTTFFKKYNLNPNKKTICFSSNDQTSPYEANYLEDVCKEINKMEEIDRPQILFRRNPVDKSDRFDKILAKNKNLLFPINPDWRTEKENSNEFTTIYPSINDLNLLVNTVMHSDVVINLGSTMAHDFAVLGKPCLYLNYNPVENSTFKVEEVYRFQHFKSMDNLDAVGWINSKSEISTKVMSTINFPDKVGINKKDWMMKIVKYPLQQNSQLLVNEILLIIKE